MGWLGQEAKDKLEGNRLPLCRVDLGSELGAGVVLMDICITSLEQYLFKSLATKRQF